MTPALRLILGVALVGLGALAGVAAHRFVRPRATLQATVATALPRLPPGLQAAMPVRVIPMALPDLTLADANGVAHRLAEYAGHPLIVNFWATWCEPCRREIPLLIRLRHERHGSALQVVGIAVDFRAAVVKYAHAEGIDYPLLIGEDTGLEAANAFGMDLVFPFSVFADSQSRVVAVKVGELHQDEADFILDRIQEVDRGKLTLDQAKEAIASRMKDLAIERAKHA